MALATNSASAQEVGSRERYLKDWGRFTPEVYIVTRREVKVYRTLRSNPEREAFITRFWEMRDPTPGTPQNETRMTFDERVDKANARYFSNGGPGWKTDMGRVLILMGEPDEVVDSTYGSEKTPSQTWIYRARYGDKGRAEERFSFYYARRTGSWEMIPNSSFDFDTLRSEYGVAANKPGRPQGIDDLSNLSRVPKAMATTNNNVNLGTPNFTQTTYGAAELLNNQVTASAKEVEARLRSLRDAVSEERKEELRVFGGTPGWNYQLGLVPGGVSEARLRCIAKVKVDDDTLPLSAEVELAPLGGGEAWKLAQAGIETCKVGEDHVFELSVPAPSAPSEFRLAIFGADGRRLGIGATVVAGLPEDRMAAAGMFPPLLFQSDVQGCFRVSGQNFSPVLGSLVRYGREVALQLFVHGPEERVYHLDVMPEWLNKGSWEVLPGTRMALDITSNQPQIIVLSDALADRIGEWRVRLSAASDDDPDHPVRYIQHFVIQ